MRGKRARSLAIAVTLIAILGSATGAASSERAPSATRAEHHGPFAIVLLQGVWQIAAHVTPAAPATAMPTGTVRFMTLDGTTVCPPTALEALPAQRWKDPARPESEAMCNLSDAVIVTQLLREGFVALYSGDARYAPSSGVEQPVL